MISFTIDTSIFALPQKDDNIEIELKNLQYFITNMYYLQHLEKCPSVTVSYMNHIPKILLNNKFNPIQNNLFQRIKDIKCYTSLNHHNPDIIEFFKEKYRKIIRDSYIDETTKEKIYTKGKIGIYENIPERNEDPSLKYRNILYDKKIYPKEYKKNFSINFKLYLGFIGELNSKYLSKNNYLVISGDKYFSKEKVTLCFNEFKETEINIVGIQQAHKTCPTPFLKNIDEVISELNNYHNIIIGQQVTIDNIIKNINFNENNDKTSKNNFLIKIYHYLKTLKEICEIINNEKIQIDNKELVFFANSHGCLCSPDNPKYEKCPRKTRHFQSSEGTEEYFTLHLKPITYNKKSDNKNLTRRIYFKWENNKILVGWIGEHLQSCSNEPESECVKINCQYRPQNH